MATHYQFHPCHQRRHNVQTYNLYNKYIVPDKWLFNDFGHQTCYFFKDVNKKFRLDKKEHIHSEFIHTTPTNEAETAKGEHVLLEYSHGCIHIKPKDIDDMIAKNYLKKGNLLIVHSYDRAAPIDPVQSGRNPFEVHFYPRASQILIFGAR